MKVVQGGSEVEVDVPLSGVKRVKLLFVGGSAVLGAVAASWVAPSVLTSLFVQLEKSFTKPNPSLVLGPSRKTGKAQVPDTAQTVEATTPEKSTYPQATSVGGILPFTLAGALLGAYLGNAILEWTSRRVERWNKMAMGDRVTAVLGVVMGFVMSMPFLVIFQSLPINATYVPWIITVLTFGSITLSIYILQSISEFFPWSRARGPMRRSGVKVLDTNVIIDGRIREVARAGFLEGKIYVPQFVLEELQFIADNHDPLRRQRGKRGLDTLHQMQNELELEVGTQDKLAPEAGDPVDSRLVRLARALGADLVTNDHNLNRVAALQEVKVLNINDLALSLRPNVLPQEKLTLKVIREGQQYGQGVGYLDDGTMVVVENGAGHINQVVEVEVTQVIQTERGKMIFGEVGEDQPGVEDDSGSARRKISSIKHRNL